MTVQRKNKSKKLISLTKKLKLQKIKNRITLFVSHKDKKINTEKMSNFLMSNLIENTKSELKKLKEKEETEIITRAMQSKEVTEARRISKNIKIQSIKQLRNQMEKLIENKRNLAEMIKIMEKQEKQLKKQIKIVQSQIDN